MVKTPYVIGIDPGGAVKKGRPASAAFALYDGTNVECHDFETRHYSSGHQVIDPKWLLCVIAEMQCPPIAVSIERVASSPKMGVSSAFNFGHGAGVAFGAIRAALLLADCQFESQYVRPQDWKRALGLSNNKQDSLDLARVAFPNDAERFKLKKHHNHAEAALIAAHAWHNATAAGDESVTQPGGVVVV